MTTILTRDKVAAALDATHTVGERGPKTFQARQRVAKWLDTGTTVTRKLRHDVTWLRYVAEMVSVKTP